jgi:hypothetical protein
LIFVVFIVSVEFVAPLEAGRGSNEKHPLAGNQRTETLIIGSQDCGSYVFAEPHVVKAGTRAIDQKLIPLCAGPIERNVVGGPLGALHFGTQAIGARLETGDGAASEIVVASPPIATVKRRRTTFSQTHKPREILLPSGIVGSDGSLARGPISTAVSHSLPSFGARGARNPIFFQREV